jgi:hypothetical protein
MNVGLYFITVQSVGLLPFANLQIILQSHFPEHNRKVDTNITVVHLMYVAESHRS